MLPRRLIVARQTNPKGMGGGQLSKGLSVRTGGPHSHARIPVLKKQKDPLLWSKAGCGLDVRC